MPSKEEQLRVDLEARIKQSYADGDTDKTKKLLDLWNKLPPEEYIFDELSTNESYLSDLHANWIEETGEEFKGSDKNLIEKEFEYWNGIENNLALGSGEVLFHFQNMDDEEKTRTLNRFNVYNKTKPFGKGSRSTWEQVKGVTSAMLSDPLNWVGGGLIMKTLSGPALRKGFTEAVINTLKVGSSQAAAGAGWATAEEAKSQATEQVLGGREGFDKEQLTGAAKVGAATGIAVPAAAKGLGAAGRVVTHPLQSISKTGKAMAKGLFPDQSRDIAQEALKDEAIEKISAYGSSEGSEIFRSGINETLDKLEQEFMERYDELALASEIDTDDLLMVVEAWEKTPYLDVPNSIKRDADRLIEGKLDPKDALRLMRKHTQDAINSAKRGSAKYDTGDIDELAQFKKEFTHILTQAAEESGIDDSKQLDRAFAIFKNIGKKGLDKVDDKYGKLILKAAAHPADATALIRKLSTGETALDDFSSFITKLYELDELVEGVNVSGDIIKGLQKGIAYRLSQEQPRQLDKFLTTDNGVKFLTMLFPEQKNFFDNTKKLFDEIDADKVVRENIGGGMIKSNIIAGFGRKIAGPIGSLGSIVGIGKILESPRVRKAIIDSYRPIAGSSIQTRTKRELLKILDPDQAKLVQDFLWAGTAGASAVAADEKLGMEAGPLVDKVGEVKEQIRGDVMPKPQIPMQVPQRPDLGVQQPQILPPSMRNPNSLIGQAAQQRGYANGGIVSLPIGDNRTIESENGGIVGVGIGCLNNPSKDRSIDVKATLREINKIGNTIIKDVENETYASLI